VLSRVLALTERLSSEHGPQTVALVSHGDVIKIAIAHFLGVHLDLVQRIEIGPASISVVDVRPYGPLVLLVNGSCVARLLAD
jgi:broad specificity phosphatase PhoE